MDVVHITQEQEQELTALLNTLLKLKKSKEIADDNLKETNRLIKEVTFESIKIMNANMLRKYTVANESTQYDFIIDTQIAPTYLKDDEGNIIPEDKEKAIKFLEEQGYLMDAVNVKGVSIDDIKKLGITYDKIDIHTQTLKKIVNTLLKVDKLPIDDIENSGIVLNTFSDLKIKEITD